MIFRRHRICDPALGRLPVSASHRANWVGGGYKWSVVRWPEGDHFDPGRGLSYKLLAPEQIAWRRATPAPSGYKPGHFWAAGGWRIGATRWLPRICLRRLGALLSGGREVRAGRNRP